MSETRPEPRQRHFRNAWLSLLVALGGVLVSLLVSGTVRNHTQQQAQERFERHAERIENEVRRRFDLPLYSLRGAVGLHAGSARVDLAEFRAFIDALNLRETLPGVRGLGLIERVPSAATADHEARVNAEDGPGFKIRQLQAADHAQRYVVRYVEPLLDNVAARGVDIGSEPQRRDAIERAIRTGRPTMTPPVALTQDPHKGPGFLMFDPVYRHAPGHPPGTPAQREAALDGVFYSPVVAAELLGNVAALADGLVDFELFAGTRADALENLVFDSDGHLYAQPPLQLGGRAFQLTRRFDLLGQPYLLQASSTAAFDATAGGLAAPATLIAGLLMTALLTYLVSITVRGRERAETLASRMTQDLDRLAKVAQRTSNAVVITDVQRRITWVNEGFERITGYRAEEAIGQSPRELLQSPNTDMAVVARMRRALETAQPFQGELLNRRKDGREYWLQVEIQPLRDAGGTLTGFMAIESDITAHKLAEHALRDSSERMTLAANSAGLGVWEIDMPTGQRIWDSQMYRLFGIDPQALPLPTPRAVWRRMLHPDDRAHTENLLAEALAGGRPFDTEFRIVWDNGTVRHLRGAAQVLRDADGQPLRTIGLNHDVTERRQLEQEMRSQNALMRSILDALPCGMSVFNNGLELVASNTEYRRLLDFPDHLFERQPPRFEDFIRYNAERGEYGSGDVEVIVAEIVERARGVVRPHRFERVRPAGVPLEIQGAPMPGGGFVTTYIDISERKRAEQAIAQKEALLRGAIDTVNEAFVLFDPDDRLVFCNEKYRDIYATTADLIVPGVRFEELLRLGAARGQYPAAIGRVEDWLAERMAQHRAANTSLVQRLDDGRVVRVVERRMADGHTVGFRIDITDLVRATEAAEAASRSKSQFLANMSHEIRTPMNAILGMLALLQKTSLSSRQADYTGKAEGAARSLLGLLNDILDFSKVEAGRMALDPHPFETESLLRDLGLILSMNAAGKPVEVLYDIDPALPTVLVGDALRLQQVLVNLGGNAVKFTDRGEVVVSLALVERGDHGATVDFAVRDTGIGIAPDNQAKIFSGFTQAEADTTRRFGGTGLGLAISQRLVALMGGTLRLDSEVGVGSHFHFRLRLGLPDTPPHTLHAPHRGASRGQLLVVDDNPVACRLVAHMLQALGWTVDTADSGAAALARLQGQTVRYEAVFVDWQMPDMDGWAVCQQLRAWMPHDGPRLIMLTAHGRELLHLRDDTDLALLDGFLTKPVTPTTLREALHTARGTRMNTVTPRPAGTGVPRLSGLRLLLAEDNRINQQVARELLESEGAQVTVVDNGEEAVRAVAQTERHWDAVLMDLQMPVMDGIAATRQIRVELDETALPIVAMTANAMPADREACLAAGMNEHVGKPFELNQLVDVLRHVTGLGALPTPPAMPVPDPGGDSSPAALAALAAGVSLAPALARLGGRQDVYQRLLLGFLDDAEGTAAALSSALAAADWPSLRRQLHTLKGLASTLGLDGLAHDAAQAESWAASAPAPGAASPVPTLCERLLAQHTPGQALAAALAPPATTPVDTAGDHPADTATWSAGLRDLVQMLERSDMAATDAVDGLQQRFGAAVGAPLAELHDAVMGLDFERARRLCERLLSA
ncbi:PAS-domain containing protein [Hydrogenophaga sp. OTU3427]|uniref:PAS-domain containing protein n=1 Tax=Hydrogenophaga sp. OTU3427 TaxID=3043856 RepID=UPI00313E16E1